MIPLVDFKQQALYPLLRGEKPSLPDTTPITLFAAQLDQPLRYVFETDCWDEVYGASRRLNRVYDRVRAILSEDGYTSDNVLRMSADSLFTLCQNPALAERWADSIERAAAAETDIITVSTVIHTLTLQQILGGLYRAPRTVLGVPGFNDYQERINRYYGLDSASTVPGAEAIARRRHFGEAVALMHSLMARARESRQIAPFYEALPFAERCASCRSRPAETLKDGPVCGVCLRKRQAAAKQTPPDRAALIWIEAQGLEGYLEDQRSPFAYRQVCGGADKALYSAAKARPGLIPLTSGVGWIVMITEVSAALKTASDALQALSAATAHQKLDFSAAIAISAAPGQFRALYDLAEETIANLRRAEGSALDVRVCQPGQPLDRFRKPFTLEEAQQLIAGLSILREAALPAGSFAQLAEQAPRGSASLYYTFERSKLPQAQQRTLDRLEQVWTPGPRFYSMLAAALAFAQSD